jgi:hypothetical protein
MQTKETTRSPLQNCTGAIAVPNRIESFPLIFLQNWPVGCRVSGNLSERDFRLGICELMAYVLNYNLESFTTYHYNSNLVVVKVVVFADYRKLKCHKLLQIKELAA